MVLVADIAVITQGSVTDDRLDEFVQIETVKDTIAASELVEKISEHSDSQ